MINYKLKLFGHDNLFNHLVALEKNNKLPQKILLTGQEGIGKTTFALHFINYLLSKNEINKYDLKEKIINQDNKSHNLVYNLIHPNFFLISKNDSKNNIEIEQIRSMLSFLNKSSFNNNKKIILIDGVEYLNLNSSNALLKSLEDTRNQNYFILTHNINIQILETIKSRCLAFKLNFNYLETKNILLDHFDDNLFDQLNDDFKSTLFSPNFLINHISFIQENNLNLKALNSIDFIKYIIENKSYKKNKFISNNFQRYVEIYFTKMYLKTNNNKYYDNFLKIVKENNLMNKLNLDIDSFFSKFQHKYLNI